MIFVPRSIRPMWLHGFIIALCFLLLSAGCFQGSFTQGGIWFPKETRMIAEGVILTLSLDNDKKCAESSNFLNFFIYTPLFNWDDVHWYFPGFELSQRALCGTLVRLPWTLSLMFPYSRRMMLVLMATAQCCFWQKCFRHFRSIATSRFDGIYRWSKHCIGGWFGQILFLSAVLIVFHSR